MNFTSQICTTKEQSKRLLDLGVKAETADMYHYVTSNGTGISAMDDNFLPHMDTLAWSLHRLIDLCGIDRLPIYFGKKGKVRIRVSHIHPTHDGRSGYNHYDSLIDCIEWLIKENYFNKEYLEE